MVFAIASTRLLTIHWPNSTGAPYLAHFNVGWKSGVTLGTSGSVATAGSCEIGSIPTMVP